jgi:ribose/xylose/arabinose/galactoside ABC-type transport system permease subunit
MNLIKQISYMVMSTIAGAILALLLNVFVLEKIVIPDPCYYHSHDTSKSFDLFYEFKAIDGGHPSPTWLNLIVTILIGALTGLILGARFSKKRHKQKGNATAGVNTIK